MSVFQPIDTGTSDGNIALMKAMHEVFAYGEVIRVLWGGVWHYYANHDFRAGDYANIYNIIGADTEIEVKLGEDWYCEFEISSIIEDNDMELEFWDADEDLRNKHRLYGEGARVELYGYWPDMIADDPNGMMKCLWWGLLSQPSESEPQIFKIKARAGVRSNKLDLPRGIVYPGCPRVFGGETDPVTKLPFLTTQEQLNDHACPYNRHLPGGFGLLDPATGQPFTHCPRNSLSECNKRLGVDYGYRYYGGFDFIQATAIVTGKRGHTYAAESNSNPSIIRQSIGVTYGVAMISELQPLIWQDQRHGDPGITPLDIIFPLVIGGPLGLLFWNLFRSASVGYFSVLWPVSVGPIEGVVPQWGIFYVKVGDKYVIPEHTGKQPGTYGAEYKVKDLANLGYSKTAYFHTSLVETDFPDFVADQIKASCLVNGLRVRKYFGTGVNDYDTVWSANRGWGFYDLLTAKTYGQGWGRELFITQDWLNVGEWCDHMLNSQSHLTIGAGGTVHSQTVPAPRSTLNIHLRGRNAQEVIKGICSAGHLSTPFFWNGKVRIVGLGLEDVENPDSNTQKFTDDAETYGFRNILPGSLKYSQKSDEDIPNLLELKFTEQIYPVPTGSYVTDQDAQHGITPLFVEQTLVFEDQVAQLKAGLAGGDTTMRVVKGSFDAFGVTNFHEAARLGALIFDVGEQERGGQSNNLNGSFITWFPSSDGIQLHPYKVIQIMNAALQRYEEIPGKPFRYFRVISLKRRKDLSMQVNWQAYPLEYYKSIEAGNLIRPIPIVTRTPLKAPRQIQRVPRPVGFTRETGGRGFRITTRP